MEELRPPIVSVLGHVDHGKTSLLDAIRKTRVASSEAGGITQSIGASQVMVSGKNITFIDTPGHAAFNQMRGRGAKIADIAILVVAADDGVKPQTREAIEHIRSANIPFIVAITKVDLATADIEKTRSELENAGVYFEGRGGDVVMASVSAKNGEGIKELLDMILLIAEVQGISGSPDADLEAFVLETAKDKRGLLVSVVVRNGKIEIGSTIYSDNQIVKVRGLFNAQSLPVRTLTPGSPGQILGFETLPDIGSQISSKPLITKDVTSKIELTVSKQEDKKAGIPIIVKAKTAGSLQAILTNLPEGFSVLSSQVGEINQTDVLFAKTAKATILAFELKPSSEIAKLADMEGVKIISFKIIYELFKYLEEILDKGAEVISGKAEITAIFPYETKKVAGCRMLTGMIRKTDALNLIRQDKVIGKVTVTSMRKGKQKIIEAKGGEEFGVILEPQLDFKAGDVILSVLSKQK